MLVGGEVAEKRQVGLDLMPERLGDVEAITLAAAPPGN
jgi:hypothetical protein